MPNKMAPDHKVIYANGIGLAFGDNDCRIAFGVSDIEGDPRNIIEMVGIYMTHRTLKLLAQSTSLLVDEFEKKSGTVIPIPEDHLNTLKAAMETMPQSTDVPTA